MSTIKASAPTNPEKLRSEIKELDHKYADQRGKGTMLDALDSLQRSLILRRQLYGDDNDEVDECAKTFVTTCNSVGMAALDADHPILTFELLVS
jgi:hypothetical protein